MVTINAIAKNETINGLSTTTSITSSNNLGKDDFLKLMLTELRYQDPMEPVKDKEFIAQLAQFSALEQMQNLNKTMSNFLAEQQKAQENLYYLFSAARATDLIGKEVKAILDGGEVSGVVTGYKAINGMVKILVDGKEIPIEQIFQVAQQEY